MNTVQRPTAEIIFPENLEVLKKMPAASIDLIYIDPPFNTGRRRKYERIRTVQDDLGDRVGFAGKRYRTDIVGTQSYDDVFNDYVKFLEPRIREAYRILKSNGSFFLHLDCREVHYCKVMADTIFGRESFINEIIWIYDFGGRGKKKWPAKHENILWYAKDPKSYTFNYEKMDRYPYMAPNLAGKKKAPVGKTPTDCWWNTIVPTNGKERTGYPTQKPYKIVERIVGIHSNPGDLILDFFAGSGTTGEAAVREGRSCILIDNNPEAVQITARRLAFVDPRCTGFKPTRNDTAAARKNATREPTGENTEKRNGFECPISG